MLTDRKLRVFISSTSDLGEERASIAKALPQSFEVYLYEEDTARRQSPRERLKEILASTHAFVGILGERYGSPYPDCQEDRSIVEWEFETAESQDETELFVFKKADMRPEDVEPEQRDFLGKLAHFTRGVWLKTFVSSDDLRREVSRAMMDWLCHYWERCMEHREAEEADASPRGRMLRWGLLLLPAVGLVAVAAALFFRAGTDWMLAGVCAAMAIAILGIMILNNR